MSKDIVEQAMKFSLSVAAQAQTDKVDPPIPQRKAAEHLGISVSTLLRWRARGQGPKGFKIGGRVKYRLSELNAFISRCEDPSCTGVTSDE
ncbi:helix-turn-helix domain-containing protein [Mesorhizobium sp. KR1-2]|uniref:helix-turn-helix transcriptional regulator n=1 Tax=Mesorhizobium sp. KR1-2 TaxID=3156609 RepID=UPI0032B33170